ncbi:MAG: phenylacetate-CoA oxygenase subunit PaaI [Planctomycetes bacterium]|nr:phenylacetate-CoA oxygenase subunit PaaI [Planctomycetota bacterium]
MQIRKSIATWDDWTDYFKEWQKDIGVSIPEAENFIMTPIYTEKVSNEIEFGDFKGQHKWERVGQIPNQQMRDALLQLVFVQGDTEFASTEQQRRLLNNVPHDYDRYAAVRIMLEEMRHGVQMANVLVQHFGSSGKLEAKKLLERRASEAFPETKNPRLLGAFNVAVNNWIDFYTYTCFVDRDGKFQLTMLAPCAFAPLARSAGPMLKEEAFHLGSGNDGLVRIIKGGKVPVRILQKYLNKWISVAMDLFGKDESGTAEWAYVWSLKSRFDEDKQRAAGNTAFDRKELNHHNRMIYFGECLDIVNRLNSLVAAGQPKLTVPDEKFHRGIGRFAGQPYSVTGQLLSADEYKKHLFEVLPNEKDEAELASIFADPSWIEDKKIPADPWAYQKAVRAGTNDKA